MIALNSRTNEVLAIGQEAWQMIGRTPGYIVAVRPLRGGAITDFEVTERLIRMLFQRAGVSRFYRRACSSACRRRSRTSSNAPCSKRPGVPAPPRPS